MRKGWTIHHNGPPARCVGQPHSRCVSFWGGVRNYHVNTKKWPDIAYSFGVCPHGERFVGRGWDRSQWANGVDEVGPNDGGDSHWYTVLAFVGQDDDGTEAPTPEMVAALADLVNEGRDSGRCGMAVKPHLDFKTKPCPGPELTAICRRWDGVAITTKEDDDVAYSLIQAPAGHPNAGIWWLSNGLQRVQIPDVDTFNRLKFVGASAAADGAPHVLTAAWFDMLVPIPTGADYAALAASITGPITAAMPTALDVELLADAIAARIVLPAVGDIELETVKAAVIAALTEHPLVPRQ